MSLTTERRARLSAWIKPSSDSEKDQQDRAERMVRDAVKACPAFDEYHEDICIYTKGSYPNETNVRRDSDVDVVVQFDGCVYSDHGTGVTPPSTKATSYSGIWTPQRWRTEVRTAMVDCFGSCGVDASGKIAIQIKAVSGSRPSADVVPSFHFRRYWDTAHARWADGSCVFNTEGVKVVNWPQQQLDNGRAKNAATGRRYKYFVRALKNAENHLASQGTISDLPSYFMECLVYNVSDAALTTGDLDAGFRATLVELRAGLGDPARHTKWLEPNERKYLLRHGQKWSVQEGKDLVKATWNLMGYQ